MNKDSFNKNSQDYLGNLLSSSSFDCEDRENFSVISEPYDLAGIKYKIYPFRKLTGYLPNPEKQDEPVLYTFFILKADQETKNKFLEEVNKETTGQEYNKEIITSYYLPLSPSSEPFRQLTQSLGKMLEEVYYPGKGYKFAFHMGTIIKGFDIALIFLQINSLIALEAKYPGNMEVVFKTLSS